MEGMDLPETVACRGVEELPVPVVDEEDESAGFSVRLVLMGAEWRWKWKWRDGDSMEL
jgi:hypothetical protein